MPKWACLRIRGGLSTGLHSYELKLYGPDEDHGLFAYAELVVDHGLTMGVQRLDIKCGLRAKVGSVFGLKIDVAAEPPDVQFG